MESATESRTVRGADTRETILFAGKDVFLEEGYEGASMDRIAERAGVTKRTVYAHYASKHALFSEAVARGCANVVGQMLRPDQLGPEPRAGLFLMLRTARELMLSPGCLRLERVVAAEAERHPEFAAQVREAFALGEDLLRQALDGWVAAGKLNPHDTALAARMLNNQVAQASSMRGLMGEPDDALAVAAVDATVILYLAAYEA